MACGARRVRARCWRWDWREWRSAARLAGYCGDRYGRRPALIGCVSLFGLATVATAFVHSVAGSPFCASSRGMGAGGALPNASALAAEFAPIRPAPTAVKLTIVCVPLGGMLGGLIAARVLPAYGWRTLYEIGGAMPLIFALILWWAFRNRRDFWRYGRTRWPATCAFARPDGSCGTGRRLL